MRTIQLFLAAAATLCAAPTITNVVNAANPQAGIASATWISVFGSNLAGTTNQWSTFTGGALPSTLDGVSVTVNGRAAYIAFVSPGQINVLAPDDPASGKVPVVVTNAQGSSSPYMVSRQAYGPALFAYSAQAGAYAVIQAALNYEIVAPAGLLGQAVRTVRAAPGEGVILYATGLGPTNPAQPTDRLITTPAPVANPVTVTIGGQTVTPQFAGLIGSGLYQINLAIPQVPNGDAPIVISVGGAAAPAALVPVEALALPIGGQTGPRLAGCISGPVTSISYSIGRISYGAPDDVVIGGTDLCPTCAVQTPLFPEFAARMELALRRNKKVQACYDSHGVIYQVSLQQP